MDANFPDFKISLLLVLNLVQMLTFGKSVRLPVSDSSVSAYFFTIGRRTSHTPCSPHGMSTPHTVDLLTHLSLSALGPRQQVHD